MNHIPRYSTALYVGAILFVATVFITDWLIDRFALEGPLLVIVAILPILPLTLWWRQYPKDLGKLDELERAIELKSLAWGAGLGLWLITVWALLEVRGILPEMPLFVVAPLIAGFYGAARWFVRRGYQ